MRGFDESLDHEIATLIEAISSSKYDHAKARRMIMEAKKNMKMTDWNNLVINFRNSRDDEKTLTDLVQNNIIKSYKEKSSNIKPEELVKRFMKQQII